MNAKWFGDKTTSMFAHFFVVYETHVVHATHLQMNLEWFCIWTFSWMCMMMFSEQIVCRFSTTNRCFWNWTAVCIISGSCMFFYKFVDEINGF